MAADDELADTAAASTPAPGPRPRAETAGLSGAFGRYRIERELGRGGMGFVYAAFDPELERRVALKVLGGATPGDESARLLREARAMARLASANVVTVFEVGTHGGRDFVAMELMEGGTLAAWLAAKRRATRDVIAAFTAAGRGLADAHLAGLVHRDFKPANVLRARDGRFAVTDFGLARESTSDAAPERDVRVSEPVAVPPPTALDAVTQTGWVLGTPQYMAPEQWENHAVTPATDQFAFCVSLWEGVSGERPYRGATPDQLRAAVARGPRELDPTGVPRRLRPILLRGLDPDPDQRWPSMNVLLAALARAQRRPKRWAQLAAALAIAAAVVVAFAWSRGGAARCPEPARDPDALWTAEARAALVARGFGSDQVAVIDGDVAAWHTAWDATCKARATPRAACLEGVVGHLGAVLHASAHVPAGAEPRDTALGVLVPPAVCELAEVPPLLAHWTPADEEQLARLIAAAVAGAREPPAAVPLTDDDACGHLLAAATSLQIPHGGSASESAIAPRADPDAACADDSLAAAYEVTALSASVFDGFSDAIYDERVATLDKRYTRFRDPIVRGFVAYAHGEVARDEGLADDAIASFRASREIFATRGLHARESAAAAEELRARFGRWSAVDRAEVPAALAAALAVGRGTYYEDDLAQLAVLSRWSAGDLESAHESRPRAPAHVPQPVRTSGVVVDAHGAPVAGAEVDAAFAVRADRVGVAAWLSDTLLTTTTDAAGRFAIDGVPEEGVVVAIRGAERSLPIAPGGALRLELRPTTRLAGTASFAAGQPGHAVVAVGVPGAQAYRVLAPIAADGTWEIAGAPPGPLLIGTLTTPADDYGWWRPLTAAERAGARVALDVPPLTRAVTVITRGATSAPLATARVIVLDGAPAITDARALMQYERAADMFAVRTADRALAGIRLRHDDLAIRLLHLPAVGALTACAFGSFDNLHDDAGYAMLSEHLAEIPVTCAPIGLDDTGVVLELAPSKRVGD